MKEYGIILIGCGHIGSEHIADIHYRDNINIVAVIDVNLDAAKRCANTYKATEYSDDYTKYLSDPRVDIAIVASYTASHKEITSAFLSHGKSVLCEKPVATDLESGREFFRIAEASESKAVVAHILRHNKSYQKIKELIDSGAIGDIKLIRMVQNHHAMNWPRYKNLLADCTPVLDCGVHYFDVVRWFTGSEFAKISGFKTVLDEDSPNYNYTFVNFELENGCVGYYEAGWSNNTASMNMKEFIGSKGRIQLTLVNQRSSCQEEGDLITVYHSDTRCYETINVDCKYKDMYAQIMSLIDEIEGRGPGNPTLSDAQRAFEVAVAADMSVKNGTTVLFKDGIPLI